jgi:hypothetical protein
MTIPYEVDPSLHTTEPHEVKLDDGFSRPEIEQDHVEIPATPRPGEPVLSDKSAF